MNKTSQRILAVGLPLAAVAATGIAFAAWTATGTGSGAAKATSMSVSVTAATAPTADLFPGGSAGALVVKVHNDNSGPIVVTAVATDAAGTQGGCTTPALTFTPGSALTTAYSTVASRTIAAGGDGVYTLPGVITMGNASDDCQGKSLTYPVSVTAVTP